MADITRQSGASEMADAGRHRIIARLDDAMMAASDRRRDDDLACGFERRPGGRHRRGRTVIASRFDKRSETKAPPGRQAREHWNDDGQTAGRHDRRASARDRLLRPSGPFRHDMAWCYKRGQYSMSWRASRNTDGASAAASSSPRCMPIGRQ